MPILTGETLARAVSTARESITLRDSTGKHKLEDINAEQAVILLASGKVQAIGRGNGTLRYFKAIDPTIRIPAVRGQFVKCWRNQEAAVIAWHGSQFSPGIRALDGARA